MFRLIWISLMLSVSLYADGSCNCPPSVIVYINGFNYSSSFDPVTTDGGVSYSISQTITDLTPDSSGNTHIDAEHFIFSLNVTTHPDPDIDFDTSISGDPTVGIRITQTFLGGPLFTLNTASAGFIQDLDGDGHASALGSEFIQTVTVGSTVVQQNTGCNLFDLPSSEVPCGPETTTSQNIVIPPVNPFIPSTSGIIVMDIGFTLSDGDKYTLHGSAALVPEASAMIPMIAGLFAIGVVTGGEGEIKLTPSGRLRALTLPAES